MPWAWHKTEQLRTREDKIEYLRQEEQEQRLGEMRLNSHNRERHPCDIAQSVSGEGRRWESETYLV